MIKLKDLLLERKVSPPNNGEFKNKDEFHNWLQTIGLTDTPNRDIVNTSDGEILMQPGDTKLKAQKSRRKALRNYYRVSGHIPPLVYGINLQKFKDYYTVLEKDLDNGMSDRERDELYAADYDLSYSIPVKISRKDRKKFLVQDLSNIQQYEKYWNNERMPDNIKLILYAKKGKSVADGEYMLV